MNVEQCLVDLRSKYQILDVINCSDYKFSLEELYLRVLKNHQQEFKVNERIVFCITEDWLSDQSYCGSMLQSVQSILNDVDISNFFVCCVTTNPSIAIEYDWILKNISTDVIPVHVFACTGDYKVHQQHMKSYTKYSKIQDIESIADLNEQEKNLLFRSDSFCILPWISLNIDSDSRVKVCCMSTTVIGDCSKQPLKEIWNSDAMIDTRTDMLHNKKIKGCEICYIKESLGSDSLRKSSSRRFFKHIKTVQTTNSGRVNDFKLRYLDARFNNLCNLACRMCNPKSSSSWHKPAVYLGKVDKSYKPLLTAGKSHADIYKQILEHVSSLEKIYFAGGEPFMIEEFYNILDVLDKQGRHDVELVYNTNLTKYSLKQRSIFDAWKNFKKISIGASLDGELKRGEYLRTGCNWSDVVEFRTLMLQQRPDIDFYISATCSIVNALHLPDFHKSWVDKGLIEPQDFHVGTLFDPNYMRVDTAPEFLKQKIKEKYQSHIEWLQPKDHLGRATNGYKTVLSMMMCNDKQFDAQDFWKKTDALDQFHSQFILDAFPELSQLPRS